MSELMAVIEVGYAVGVDGVRYPTAVIDTTGRPEVSDLPRVHAIEGIGDITTALIPVPLDDERTVVVLMVTLTSPVTAEFGMAFLLPDHRGLLLDAADAGSLLIATTPPDATGGDNPPWLAVSLDRASVIEALGNI